MTKAAKILRRFAVPTASGVSHKVKAKMEAQRQLAERHLRLGLAFQPLPLGELLK
jgi:ethanolamine ammonia-lyase large subunit